jgi:hypothetical protein
MYVVVLQGDACQTKVALSMARTMTSPRSLMRLSTGNEGVVVRAGYTKTSMECFLQTPRHFAIFCSHYVGLLCMFSHVSMANSLPPCWVRRMRSDRSTHAQRNPNGTLGFTTYPSKHLIIEICTFIIDKRAVLNAQRYASHWYGRLLASELQIISLLPPIKSFVCKLIKWVSSVHYIFTCFF